MKPHGNRAFYQVSQTPENGFPDDSQKSSPPKGTKKLRSKGSTRGCFRDVIQMIDANTIGKETVFQGPFGPRRIVYLDHTASGQALKCIEEYIREHVLPYYSNTHTTGTITSAQTTLYRHEARDIIRNAVGASEHDVVIFCGSGATGPVHKIVNALTGDRNKPKPLVLMGPYEHHSNILPWREAGATVITIPETENGVLDIEFLEKSLIEASNQGIKDRLLVGSFSAASNLTGALTDDCAITILLHKYGALSVWDYSAAAPHAQIVTNPIVISANEQGLAKKDALFFSGHKFVGGPQTPGVLIAKNSLFANNPVPNGGGGGSIFFVTEDSHRYLKNTEFREEGGTPAIVESIRLGLVFKLKETVGAQNIVLREAGFVKKLLDDWSKVPEIRILGSTSNPRVPIISFLIEHLESGYYLHHNYVVVLLNDLFGIQGRGGCGCAGPYGMSLLGIDLQLAHEYETLLLDDSRLDRDHLRRRSECSAYELFRPGFTRLSISYYSSVQEATFVSEAVQLVAKYGWKLLPLYTCNPETGEFHHHSNPLVQHRKWLSWAAFNSEGIRCKERTRNNSEDYPNYAECLEQAKNIFSNADNLCKRRALPNQSLIFDSSVSHLKWFLLPSESLILNNSSAGATSLRSPKPFAAKRYTSTTEQAEGVKYYPYSIPYQIMQSSAWSNSVTRTENSATNATKTQNLQIKGNSHWESVSSSNDSDNEYFVLGDTVTGPSIHFSGSSLASASENAFSTESSPTLENKMGQITLEEMNSSLCQPCIETPVNIGNGNQVYNTFSQTMAGNTNYMNDCQISTPANIYTMGPGGDCMSPMQYSSSGMSTITTTQEYGQFMTQSGNAPSPVNGIPGPISNYQLAGSPMGYSSPTPSPSMYQSPMPGNSITYSNNCMSNLNLNLGQQSPAYYPQNDQNMIYTNNIVSTGQAMQTYPQYQQEQISPSQYHNGTLETQCGQCASPSPTQQYYQYPQQIQQSGQYQPNNNMNYAVPVPQQQWSPSMVMVSPPPPTTPVAVINPAAMQSYNSGNSSPGPGSPVVSSEINEMNNAMRRVTTEIAKEIQSEIREIITQVEQGIDPDSSRARANSFNSKDKRLERFKKRARTLSGQVLNGNFKKSDLESAAATFARSQTIDAIWNSTDSFKKVDSTPTELRVAPQTADQKKQYGGGTKWHCPPKNIIKQTMQALSEFPMIQNGDRVLVCVSGGKDSLTLLHTIKQIQYISRNKGIDFTFGAVTVDPGSSAYDPSPLKPYMEALGVPYFFEQQGIMPTALEKGPESISSICSFCSRLKRGRIYATARQNSYNVLALGQHLDDLAESFLMSVFHNGFMRTMKACYTVKEGDLRVIRPFINVREKTLRDFAESRGLPIIPENCPACFDAPTERHRVKQLLAQQEILFPKLYRSLRSAMQPLMAINKTGMEKGAGPEKQGLAADCADEVDEEQFCK